MSDSDFVDVGDELVVSISGYPVGKAVVKEIYKDSLLIQYVVSDTVPLNIKDYDTVDGYGHGSQPLEGVNNA